MYLIFNPSYDYSINISSIYVCETSDNDESYFVLFIELDIEGCQCIHYMYLFVMTPSADINFITSDNSFYIDDKECLNSFMQI